jgi:hypothetical protein
MNPIHFIKQSYLADKLGKYKLADYYYSKAIKIAAGASSIEKVLEEAAAKGVDKAIIESIIRDSTLEGEALVAKLVEKGLSEEVAAEIKVLSAEERIAMLDAIPDVPPSDVPPMDVPPKDVPPDVPPVPDTPPSKFEKFKTFSKEKMAQVGDALKNLAKKSGKKILITGAVITGLLTAGYFVVNGILRRPDGSEANEEDLDAAMYNLRMQAGQQQRQNSAAEAFIEKNKENPKIKDQRDWYNLALQNGDKNFANDVIALVKKRGSSFHGSDKGRNA